MKNVSCDTASCFLCQSCLLPWNALTALKKQTLLFRKGEPLFKEGEPVNGMYFTLNGAVKVHKPWGAQKELIIRFVAGGDIVGLRGLGESSTFPVSATALEATTACYIPETHIQASLQANPTFSHKLLMRYATELQKAEQRMTELAQMDVKGRLARALLELRETFGADEEGFVNLTISRQDIAAYAGTIYETVFKVFTEWIGAGIISTTGKRVQILQLAQLIKLSQ